MKTDEKLDALLHEWRCDCASDPWLEQRVWLRINHTESHQEELPFWERLPWLQSSAFAAALLMVAVAGGIGAGEWRVRAAGPQAGEQLAERYLESINPVALAANHREGGR